MATSLAAMTARRAATLCRLTPPSSSATRASSLISRRGLAGAADHHGPPKVDIWKDPMSPSKWKEEHFVLASLSGWALLFYGAYNIFAGGKKEEVKKEEKVVEAAK